MPNVASKTWTYQDYLELDDDQRYEIYRGELIMCPAPNTHHQGILSELLGQLYTFNRSHHLGVLYPAPVDVILDESTVVQPDIVFVLNAHRSRIEKRGIFGAPDLVVEIISPGSITHDRYTKQALYSAAGIPEYWLLDPANQTLEVLHLEDNGYTQADFAAEQGPVTSAILKGFSVEVAELMAAL